MKRKKQAKAAPKRNPTHLSARQEKFCLIYVTGTTATEAYSQAYGNKKSAEAASSRLLTSVKVQARLEALRKEAAAGAVLNLQESLAYLRRAVLTPIGDVDERSDLCQAAEYLVQGGIRGRLRRGTEEAGNEEAEPEVTTVKIRIADKLKALELNARLQGFLSDSVKLDAGDALTDLLGLIRSGN